MKKTVGSADTAIRIILGLILLIIAFAVSVGHALKVILIVVGVIAILTAVTGLCPLYSVLGISTRKGGKKAS